MLVASHETTEKSWPLVLGHNGLESMKYFLGKDNYDKYHQDTLPMRGAKLYIVSQSNSKDRSSKTNPRIMTMRNSESDKRRITARNHICHVLYN